MCVLIYGSKADRIYTGVRPRIDPQVSYQPGSHLFGLTVWALIGAGAPAQIWAGQRVAARSVYAQPLDAASSGRTASSSCLLSCVDQQPASMAHRACRRPPVAGCRPSPPVAAPRRCRLRCFSPTMEPCMDVAKNFPGRSKTRRRLQQKMSLPAQLNDSCSKKCSVAENHGSKPTAVVANLCFSSSKTKNSGSKNAKKGAFVEGCSSKIKDTGGSKN